MTSLMTDEIKVAAILHYDALCRWVREGYELTVKGEKYSGAGCLNVKASWQQNNQTCVFAYDYLAIETADLLDAQAYQPYRSKPET